MTEYIELMNKNYIFIAIGIGVFCLMGLRKVFIHRHILSVKDIVAAIFSAIFWGFGCFLVFLERIGGPYAEFILFLALILAGLGEIFLGYFMKRQEEFAKMGRKTIFKNGPIPHKFLLISGGVAVLIGLLLMAVGGYME